ncbi:hypothetical protein EN860_035570, partial [Mesorhizobium sp. M00.F.Ca.ET.217.01.1.1]
LMSSTILEMRDITKTFPGVKALSNVNLSVELIRNSAPWRMPAVSGRRYARNQHTAVWLAPRWRMALQKPAKTIPGSLLNEKASSGIPGTPHAARP